MACEENCVSNEPFVYAILAAVLAVIFTEIAIWVRTTLQLRKNRTVQLNLIQKELEDNTKCLDELKNDLGQDKVYKSIIPTPFYNFLNSNIINLQKDEELIKNIHTHLNNINQIKHALQIIELRSAGSTEIQANSKKTLENNLKNSIDQFKIDVTTCLTEISKKTGSK